MKTWSTPVRAGNSGIVPCSICNGLIFKTALACEGFNFVKCVSCGLVQMNPQPLKEEILKRYSDAFGKDYLAYEIENEASFLKLQQLALKDAAFFKLEAALMRRGQEKPSVLDIGCATGSLLAFLSERGWNVTGVEISPGAQYARDVKKLDVRSLPLEENKFSDNCFDVVLASHLIEHLNDPFSFLKEIRRILKENGCVFLTTPNISGFQARFFKGLWRSAIFDHLYLFSVKTLKAMLKKNGFKVKSVHTWGGIAAGLAPVWLKKIMDFLAKRFCFGDVMIIKAEKFSI